MSYIARVVIITLRASLSMALNNHDDDGIIE